MFSKIQDLDRYKQDQKRFRLAIDSTSDLVQEQGKQLLKDLIQAVVEFDGVMDNLVLDAKGTKLDHATAQVRVQEAKTAIENWVAKHAPNLHMENS